jgi:hypothetical protein
MHFVCLVTAPGHVIEAVRLLDLSSDAEACDRAMTLARERSAWHGYELWREGRKLAAYFPPSMLTPLKVPPVLQRRPAKLSVVPRGRT